MLEFKVIENLKPNKDLTDILKNFKYKVKPVKIITINNFFAAASKLPSVSTAGAICAVLGVSLDRFYGISDTPAQIMTERLDHKDEVIAGLKRADKMHRRIIYALLIVIILLLIYGITLDVLNPDMGLFRGECERSARKQGDLDALRTFGGRRSSRRKKTTPGLDFCRKRLSYKNNLTPAAQSAAGVRSYLFL